ncbi:NAD(P)-binding domain-containing protein, partial [Pseudomonadota bacterium]
PVFNHNKCIGCGDCARACHEKDVIGIIHGKAQLITPTNCIGHGACQKACTSGAITLVFGTAIRGVDIPAVNETFETNVPGVYIAGELGGMGLIRNAIMQGTQAMQSIIKKVSQDHSCAYDVVIIGAGPAGFAATLQAKAAGLRYLTVEQESLGGTVATFPRGKIAMTSPIALPLGGKMHFREVQKEKLINFWEQVYKKTDIKINYQERLESINSDNSIFEVTTNRNNYQTATVLLALGRRGTPRKLGARNEGLVKVVYRLDDPEQYQGQHVLVVGGGDSAIEASLALADQSNAKVTLSYRSDTFSRAKPKNRDRIENAEKSGTVRILYSSTVESISAKTVALDHKNKKLTIQNDAVLVCIGGVLPTPMLKKLGIMVETKYGEA